MSSILVIDDTTLVREALCKLLEHAGYTALRAANGKEAWATMYHHAPNLVLLDLMMPQMDGVTFLRLVRHSDRWKNLPVIVLTGLQAEDKLVRNAMELGVSEVVQKASYGIDELLAHVNRYAPPARSPRKLRGRGQPGTQAKTEMVTPASAPSNSGVPESLAS